MSLVASDTVTSSSDSIVADVDQEKNEPQKKPMEEFLDQFLASEEAVEWGLVEHRAKIQEALQSFKSVQELLKSGEFGSIDSGMCSTASAQIFC